MTEWEGEGKGKGRERKGREGKGREKNTEGESLVRGIQESTVNNAGGKCFALFCFRHIYDYIHALIDDEDDNDSIGRSGRIYGTCLTLCAYKLEKERNGIDC